MPLCPSWRISAVTALLGLGQNGLLVALPVLAAASGLPLSRWAAAILVGSMLFLAGSPFWGRVSDRCGPQRVAMQAVAGYTLSFGFIGGALWLADAGRLSPPQMLALLVTARVLYGLTASGLVPACQQWSLAMHPERARVRSLAYVSAGLTGGRLLGPLVAGGCLLVSVHALFVVLAACGLLGLAVLCTVPRVPPQRPGSSGTGGLAVIASELPRLLPYWLAAWLLAMAVALMQLGLPAALLAHVAAGPHHAAGLLSALLFLGALGALAVQLGVIRARRLSERTVMALGVVGLACGLGLLTQAQTWPLFALGVLAASSGAALAVPGYTAAATGHGVPATAAGFLSMAHTLGYGSAALAVSLLAQSSLLPVAFAAALSLLALPCVTSRHAGLPRVRTEPGDAAGHPVSATRESPPMPATQPSPSDRDADPAATCFFNALLRETAAWRLVDAATGSAAVLPVDDGELHLRLRHRSAGGECRFRWPVLWREGARREPVTFEAALDRVLATPALVGDPGGDALDAFRERVLESRANTRASLAARGDLAHLQRGPLTFAEAEQGLLAGHAFHPAPKSRDPFRADEARAYCPEHRARFALCWWAVAPEILTGRSSRAASAADLAHSLLPDALRRRLPEGFAPLPMHPWQALQLRRSEEVAALEAGGLLHWMGHSEPGWRPTSSHRSLYAPRAPWMVKGSLSARLTNSLRLLSVREVERGLFLDAWTGNGELGERFPGFALLQEPAWLGWRAGGGGKVNAASLVVLRENPLRDDPDAEAVMLATLTQQPLTAGGESLLAARVRAVADRRGAPLAETAREWFAAFCERVLTPLFGLAVEEGIVLLAHQQNIVLRLHEGLPIGLYYRDCQGSGVSERFRERHPAARPPEPCWPRETVRRYFLYYVLVNSTFAVTGALAADGLVDEAVLLADLRAHLEALRARLDGDRDCLDSALTASRLAAKGNFFCYLGGLNEATLADPARIYLTVPNPLAPLARAGAPHPTQGATA